MALNLVKALKEAEHRPANRGELLIEELNNQKLGYNTFPFVSKLSFVPLINHWKKKVGSGDVGEAVIAKEVTRRLDQCLDFLAPITHKENLKGHYDFIDLMMSGIFPSIHRDHQLALASKPFSVDGFYFTRQLRRLLAKTDTTVEVDIELELARKATIIRACCLILNSFYGQRINFDEPVIFTINRDKKRTQRHYKTEFNIQFVEIKKTKPLLPISQERINYLLSNIYDIDAWLKCIPPDNFEFHGMVIINLIDVTEEESLSRLKKILLDRNAVVAKENIEQLQTQLRNFYSLPKLRLGLTAIDYPLKNKILHKYKMRHAFLSHRIKNLLATKYQNSIYEQACKFKEIIVVEDLQQKGNITRLEKALLKEGIRSIMVVPLLAKKDQIIGLLELGSPNAYELNGFKVLKLREITPLFRTAMRRSRVEIDNEIEAIIRENYTALHPSIEWKFVESAFEFLRKREKGARYVSVEPIVFKQVFPLYGQADIIGSTYVRNQAIQADFVENMEQLAEILILAKRLTGFPLTENYLLKVRLETERLRSGINSDDEYRVMDFLAKEIHPLLKQIEPEHPVLFKHIAAYFAQLHPQLGTFYQKRKAYEESVMMINDTIADFLEDEEKRTQQIIPHYFEKARTDGIEYDIFIGQSLLQEGVFNYIHLRNMRLWQLIAMCEITRNLKLLKRVLPLPLNTAQLVLVHSTPLTIRFRLDEKKFDVDGDMNVHYAIIKKRIDKASVKKNGERLTQQGKIAIVYAQEKDKEEYLTYLDYLIQKDYITDEVEDLTLTKMQGVQGLKALRVTVKH